MSIGLVAGFARWQPEGADGISLQVAAFGEEGGPLTIPGPLLRAPAGTTLDIRIHNTLDAPLHIHGLCSRPGPCDPIDVARGEVRTTSLRMERAGTYAYWATTTREPLELRNGPESQLGGAIVIDDETGRPDRVFVMTMAARTPAPGLAAAQLDEPILAINGRSWPGTERLDYTVGETARWRVVNLSGDRHAMHLHGFYFAVTAEGNGVTDRPLLDKRRTVVTQQVGPGGSFAMEWSPTRPGQWLFHCHMVPHMADTRAHADHAPHPPAKSEDDGAGMAGLVLGIRVTGTSLEREDPSRDARRFSLSVRQEPRRYGDEPGWRFDVDGLEARRLDDGPVPGPLIVLERDEPVAVTITNESTQPTAVHWHGIELESYYDGVPGWGGEPGRISPPIGPGESFVARFAPPRAGTFIYHTHWHDVDQLAGGLYGPLVVLPPGQRYDPETDHVLVIGLNGVLVSGQREPFALNGRTVPAPVRLAAGRTNRIRIINITPFNVALVVSLTDPTGSAEWRGVAKDGADLPAPEVQRPARQPITVGETYDFEVQPAAGQRLWFEVRRGNGEWVLQAPILVR